MIDSSELHDDVPTLKKTIASMFNVQAKLMAERDALAAELDAAVNALPALLDIVEAAQQWQVAWDAIDGPHGINDARRYSEAKNALTAALAKWEKTHE